MSKNYNLLNMKFNRLKVIEKIGTNKNKQIEWLCECECGNQIITITAKLISGNTKSCGCLRDEKIKLLNQIHGMSNTRLYQIWKNMKQRCYNNNNPRYKDYGSRGIKICEEWLNNFKLFQEWSISNGYNEYLTIDRKNNDGNYEPNNCRWVDWLIQANNKNTNHYIYYNNQTHTIAEWSRIFNVSYRVILKRLAMGKPTEKLFLPVRNNVKLSKQEVKMIRYLNSLNIYTNLEIAEMFEVSQPQISLIVNNKSQKEID